MAMYISQHAIERYRERVADLPDDVIRAALNSKVIRLASSIGAPFVKLPGGQRIVVQNAAVVTVLPSEHKTHRLVRYYDHGDHDA